MTTNISTVLIGSAMISTFVLVPQLAQLPAGGEAGFGLSATEAGLLLAPGGLVMLWSAITSAGVGAVFAAIPNLIVVAVDESQTGEATGVNTVMRNIGSAVGAQVAGTIIATHVLANGLPDNAGFTIAFLTSAIGAVVAAGSVLLIPGRRSRLSPAVAGASA